MPILQRTEINRCVYECKQYSHKVKRMNHGILPSKSEMEGFMIIVNPRLSMNGRAILDYKIAGLST